MKKATITPIKRLGTREINTYWNKLAFRERVWEKQIEWYQFINAYSEREWTPNHWYSDSKRKLKQNIWKKNKEQKKRKVHLVSFDLIKINEKF